MGGSWNYLRWPDNDLDHGGGEWSESQKLAILGRWGHQNLLRDGMWSVEYLFFKMGKSVGRVGL